MELETDPERIERFAKEREDENWEFRSFLKGLDMEEEELDGLVHEFFEEVSGGVDCHACANCCRRALPLLDAADVARLAKGLAMPEETVRERYLVPDEEEKDRFTFNRKPCPMLSGNRCTVYASRPEDCRSFPHLHKDGFSSRLISVIGNCGICPIVYHVFERLKEVLWTPERAPLDEYKALKSEVLMDRVDEVFRDRPDDWRAGLEDLGFEYFDDEENLEEQEEREEQEAEPENPRQQALVDYFEGRRAWSEDLLEAFCKEKAAEEPPFALFRRYFRQANPNLKALLLHGVERHPDRVGFLLDFTFFHEFANILGTLIPLYTQVCQEETDLETFTELAQDFYNATFPDGYDAYMALCEIFASGTQKRAIVESLMAEEEEENPEGEVPRH